MKKIYTIILIMLPLFLSSCGVTQYHYTSNAHLQHYSNSTETVMNVVENDKNRSRLFFGVITAVDDGELEYLLIAPKRASGNNISSYDITHATHIDLTAAGDFNLSLKRIISQWENLENNDGFFYEFSSVPRVEIQQLDEHILTFTRNVRFFFNTTNEGSTGELILERRNYRTGETTSRSFDVNRLDDIEDLQSLIQNGIDFFE